MTTIVTIPGNNSAVPKKLADRYPRQKGVAYSR